MHRKICKNSVIINQLSYSKLKGQSLDDSYSLQNVPNVQPCLFSAYYSGTISSFYNCFLSWNSNLINVGDVSQAPHPIDTDLYHKRDQYNHTPTQSRIIPYYPLFISAYIYKYADISIILSGEIWKYTKERTPISEVFLIFYSTFFSSSFY